MTASHQERKSISAHGMSVSLRTLLFVMFISACLARWVAQFGVGLAIALAWCGAIGAGVGGILSLLVVTSRLCVPHLRIACPRDVVLCVASGVVGGIFTAACFFAGFAPWNLVSVTVHGAWFQIVADFGPDGHQVSREFPLLLLASAAFGALANSIAGAFADRRTKPDVYVALVGLVVAMAFAILSVVGEIAWLRFATPTAGPPGGRHENMLGLLPLAIPVWSAMCAAIGLLLGGIIAALWTWEFHARRSRIGLVLFWSAAVFASLVVTEIGVTRLSHLDMAKMMKKSP
jgi:hypothetical protein